ncbi:MULTISPECIES: hypothetical protein [Catenuloplanes]|uniref:Uncharacterized protein n=1 Tax=Catenuloplanes niger TaxID=587534 RepID=A0AAE3ZUS1_9ACTN|nr:hypothetical protein [Catenuloplanes niger]MDR7325307.1 hypothetical protein [Catenuloplanes niger]
MTIETTLRDELAARAATLDLPDDPWPAFAGRERRHRRIRRARAGVVAGALAVLTVLQFGAVPMPGWAPGIAVAAANNALLNSPVRGSLAGDTAWLEGMRDRVEDLPEAEEYWRIDDKSKIRFLYAADVGDARLVLMYLPLRWGFFTDSALVWYEGAAGAAPEEMMLSASGDSEQRAAVTTAVTAGTRAHAVVVGPVGTTASISSGFSYGADGRVHHNPPVSGPPGSGIAELVLPPTPVLPPFRMTLTDGGREIPLGSTAGGGGDGVTPDPAPFRAAAAAALGDRPFDAGMLGGWLESALHAHGLTLDAVRVGVRWTGTVGGRPAALFTVHRPGEGVLAFAVRGLDPPHGSREDLRLLLPADGADRRPIGWRLHAETGDAHTDRVHVVAPAGTARLTISVGGGAPAEVPLDAAGHGETRVAPDAAATMTAYAPDGTEIASSPLTPFTDGGGITGDTPATRVVP